jgi:hypothetical protein
MTGRWKWNIRRRMFDPLNRVRLATIRGGTMLQKADFEWWLSQAGLIRRLPSAWKLAWHFPVSQRRIQL